MKIYIWHDDVAPREWRWNAANQEFDLGVPVGTGATPLRAIEDLLWELGDEETIPAQCDIVWED